MMDAVLKSRAVKKLTAANRVGIISLTVLVTIILLSGLAPILPLADPNLTDLDRRLLAPLSQDAFLGTDLLGRDMFSRLVYGTRTSLGMALGAAIVASVMGTLIGFTAGFRGGVLDTALMRSIDALMAFPYLLLALAIVAVLGPGLFNALIAVAVVNIPFFARTVRGAVVSERNSDYVLAARATGASGLRIAYKHVFPNVFPPIVVAFATTLGWMIVETAGLSFLGLGAQPPLADLGSMLGEGRKVYIVSAHVAAIPGLAILVIVVLVNLAADGLRDALDPRT